MKKTELLIQLKEEDKKEQNIGNSYFYKKEVGKR